jgi:hypothetical protein
MRRALSVTPLVLSSVLRRHTAYKRPFCRRRSSARRAGRMDRHRAADWMATSGYSWLVFSAPKKHESQLALLGASPELDRVHSGVRSTPLCNNTDVHTYVV